ncbi:hypothetical protein [Streptomyces sp. NPDC056480]|uniref:hypothetical protein n=1 Tax=Streptomyces sp. NPDC056480 TaxID=3345833 RepID=UPI0036B15C5B
MNTRQEHDRTSRRPESDARYESDELEETDEPLPRDPQNQQAAPGEDPLAIPVVDWPDSAAPATDVAGTARRGGVDEAEDEALDENSGIDEPVD